MEIIFFIHHKAEAKLFLSSKVTKLHESQLLNLLDTVPDKVLICTRTRESHTPKGIFNNRQLKEFFGEDITQPKIKKRRSDFRAPLNLKIFKPHKDFNLERSLDTDEDNMFSLNQIVAKHVEDRSHTQEGGACDATAQQYAVKTPNKYADGSLKYF